MPDFQVVFLLLLSPNVTSYPPNYQSFPTNILFFSSILIYQEMIVNPLIQTQKNIQIGMNSSTVAEASLKSFGKFLLVLQLLILIFFAIFVRMIDSAASITADTLFYQRYGAWQDTNVMMLIGFGFLMTFIKTHAYSALAYTFFINAIVMQLYILFSALWQTIFNQFQGSYIRVNQVLITKSSYCVASVLIAFGGIIGRVGPKQLLIVGTVMAFLYPFNEIINTDKIKTYDAGGSTTIHTFGAYFGLGVSWMLAKRIKPQSKAESDYSSNIFAMIGTLFLWLYWPSFIFGVQTYTPYDQGVVVANTMYALTGSCLSTFIVSSLLGKKLVMEDILNASLAGGVAIGACAAILYLPAVALGIGLLAGVISTMGFHYITPFLERKIGLYDTCGIHNLHGIPGALGGIFSAILIAAYNGGVDTAYTSQFPPQSMFNNPDVTSDYIHQGGLQFAGTMTSLFFGLLGGIITGVILNITYNENPGSFFQDSPYFEVGEGEHEENEHRSQGHEKLLKD